MQRARDHVQRNWPVIPLGVMLMNKAIEAAE
jgi:hypothetical protein